MIAGYTVPERESLTEDEAGAELFKLATAHRASQGQTEHGAPADSPDASETLDEPETEVEAETSAESADETEVLDETTEDDAEVEQESSPVKRGRTLKIDGREQFVDEDEAYNGYLRQADYTRKTQAVSETSKEVAKARAAYNERLEKYDAGLKKIEDALTVMMPQEPDWDRVRVERPDEYGALYTDWRRYNDRLALVQAERARVEQERKVETDRSREARRKDAADTLYSRIPEWKDASKRDADRAKLSSLAKTYGFEDQEIAEIEDPRIVLILRDAMLYKELRERQAKAKAQIGKAPAGSTRPVKPGVPGSVVRRPTMTKPAAAAKSRLAKSGNVDDAADALFHLMRAPKRK